MIHFQEIVEFAPPPHKQFSKLLQQWEIGNSHVFIAPS